MSFMLRFPKMEEKAAMLVAAARITRHYMRVRRARIGQSLDAA
jgi:hypothetical protein